MNLDPSGKKVVVLPDFPIDFSMASMGAEEGMGRLLVLELELEEVMVCFRAMRIVSVGEGRCVDVKDKEDLVSLADRLRFMVNGTEESPGSD